MIDEWLYFGCKDGTPGHYVWREGLRPLMDYKHQDRVRRFDALLPPQASREGYIGAVSRLQGWGATALAWWDYSVDSRQGSNSVIFAPSLTISPTDLLVEAQRRFPVVFSRLPCSVQLLTQNAELRGRPLADGPA